MAPDPREDSTQERGEVPRPASTHLTTSKHGMVHIKAPGPTILQLQEHWSPTADFTAISQNLITANTVTVQENCRSVVMGAKGSCWSPGQRQEGEVEGQATTEDS